MGRTRIAVWLLESYRRSGMTLEKLLDAYPSLTADGINEAWAYARLHRTEIDQQIRDNEDDEPEA